MHDEVGREHFDGSAGSRADSENCFVEVFRAAIGQIIASNGGDHNVFQSQAKCGFSNPRRFVALERLRFTSRHGAEPARASAHVAEDHEGGRFLRVALHAVRAFGVIANSFQSQLVEQSGGEVIEIPDR